jgi:hypothetical protein
MSLSWTCHATDGAARLGTLHTAHGEVPTPVFMPVGTAGTVKAMTADSVRSTGARMILGNTYHLMLRPGAERVVLASASAAAAGGNGGRGIKRKYGEDLQRVGDPDGDVGGGNAGKARSVGRSENGRGSRNANKKAARLARLK